VVRLVTFGLSCAIPYAVVVMVFWLFVPRFYASVIEINLAQGQDLALQQVVSKGLAFLLGYVLSCFPFVVLALPAARKGWFGDNKVALFSWQLPTALAFVVLSRDLFPRLLLYLVPSLAILFAASLEPLRLLGKKSLLLAVVCAIIVPWLVADARVVLQTEQDTAAVVRYIDERVPPGAYVLSDYQELNFHARRPSTFSGAEISFVIAAGGRITGEQLIAEIEGKDVRMVILDVSPLTAAHMVALWDYDEFRAYLAKHFVLLDVLPRHEQRLEIYVKR
jgi:hypothetical protein